MRFREERRRSISWFIIICFRVLVHVGLLYLFGQVVYTAEYKSRMTFMIVKAPSSERRNDLSMVILNQTLEHHDVTALLRGFSLHWKISDE